MKAILLFITVISAYQENLKAESKMDVITETTKDKKTVFGVELYSRTKNDGLRGIKFELDFNSAQLLIGDSNRLNWGIACSDLEFCQIISQETKSDVYHGIKYDYQEGDIQLFVSKDNQLNEEDLEESDFRYIEKLDKPVESQWGVLGLSPSSNFFNYLNRLYKDFNLAVYLRQREGEWLLDLYLNHDQEEVKGEHAALKTDIWAVQGILSTFPLPKTICFDLLGNYLLNYRNSVELCNSNINKVCNGKESCKYSEADFDKAEKLTITIDSIVYDILPKDYLKEGKDNKIECVVADQNQEKDCDYSVGRYFLEKYPIMLSIGDTSKITLLERFRYKQDIGLIVAVIIGVIILMGILTGFLEILILKLKKQEEKDGEGVNERLNVEA